MTIRRLIIEIDDERPLPPQLAGTRPWGLPLKLLHQLSGGISIRHLYRLMEKADFCDRQAVRWETTVSPGEKVPPPQED